jgi:hypothetical protein
VEIFIETRLTAVLRSVLEEGGGIAEKELRAEGSESQFLDQAFLDFGRLNERRGPKT